MNSDTQTVDFQDDARLDTHALSDWTQSDTESIEIDNEIQETVKVKRAEPKVIQLLDPTVPSYFESTFERITLEDIAFDSLDATTLNPSLYNEASKRTHFYPTVKKVTELDLIREVLFMFQGTPTFIFELEEGHYQYRAELVLTHLTDRCVYSIMTKFAKLGNLLLSVFEFTQSLDRNSNTVDAFRYTIFEEVLRFQDRVIVLERHYEKGESSEFLPETTSLLWLFNDITENLRNINTLSLLLNDFNIESYTNNDKISGGLLDLLYSKLLKAEEEGRVRATRLYLTVFFATLQPLIRMLSSCFSDGKIVDSHSEFFFEISTDANGQKSCNIREASCPSFLHCYIPSFLRAFRSCLIIDVVHHPAIYYPETFKYLCSNIDIIDLKPLSLSISDIFDSLFRLTFEDIDAQMKVFLFEKVRIQNDIISLQALCFFQASNLTNLFCDEILALSKLQAWRAKRSLAQCILQHPLECTIDIDLLDIVIDPDTSVSFFDRIQIVYNVAWPINQILTLDIQKRYSRVFSFMAKIYAAIKLVHGYREDSKRRKDRLILLSFITSLASYCNNEVAASQKEWTSCTNLDELSTMHESSLSKLESKLFLNVQVYLMVESWSA